MNGDSILTSIKKLLGIAEDYKHFDADIIVYINSVFISLRQMGVGPAEGYAIEDESDEWSDYISNIKLLHCIKTYIYLKVRLLFDPPQSSAVMEAIKNSISECEFRISIEVDPGEEES